MALVGWLVPGGARFARFARFAPACPRMPPHAPACPGMPRYVMGHLPHALPGLNENLLFVDDVHVLDVCLCTAAIRRFCDRPW